MCTFLNKSEVKRQCLIVIGLCLFLNFMSQSLAFVVEKKKCIKNHLSRQFVKISFHLNTTEVIISDVDLISIQSHIPFISEQYFTSVSFFIKVISYLLRMHFKISFIVHFWLTLDKKLTMPVYTFVQFYGIFVYLFYIFTRLLEKLL